MKHQTKHPPRPFALTLLFLTLAFGTAFAAPTTSAQNISIDQIHWGFDANVLPGRFNPLTITITNPTQQPLQINFTLTQGVGLGRVGAKHIQQAYFGPGDTRILRFYPFITGNVDDWLLQWGRRGSVDIPAPDQGPPANIILNDPDYFAPAARGIRAMPDNFFPPTVAATAPLASVILDYNPRFDAAVAQAFMDWLRIGGRVCLIKGVGDAYPQFIGALTPLNNPSDSFHIGAGRVTRHSLSRTDLSQDVIEQDLGLTTAELARNNYAITWSLETPLIDVLKEFTSINHNWPLIYLVALVFVLLIGPGHYLRARKGLNYQTSIAALLITVAVFSWAFFSIGRRGYGEEGGTYTVAHAQALSDDRFLVTQYTNTFVTTGGQYTIAYETESSLFTAAQRYESVNGLINNGIEGAFDVDIPVFSNRGYMHTGVTQAPNIHAKVNNFDRRLKLDITLDSSLADNVLLAFAVHGANYYPLKINGSHLTSSSPPSNLASKLEISDLQRGYLPDNLHNRRYRRNDYNSNQSPQADEAFRLSTFKNLANPIAADHMNLLWRKTPSLPTNSPTIRLFLFAPMPANFAIQAENLTQNDSYVLYDLEVPIHDNP